MILKSMRQLQKSHQMMMLKVIKIAKKLYNVAKKEFKTLKKLINLKH